MCKKLNYSVTFTQFVHPIMKNYVEHGRNQHLGISIKRSSRRFGYGHRNLQLMGCKSDAYSADSQAGFSELGNVTVNVNRTLEIRS